MNIPCETCITKAICLNKVQIHCIILAKNLLDHFHLSKYISIEPYINFINIILKNSQTIHIGNGCKQPVLRFSQYTNQYERLFLEVMINKDLQPVRIEIDTSIGFLIDGKADLLESSIKNDPQFEGIHVLIT
jgi:hypothetical protein